MRKPQTYTTWKISCQSPSGCESLRRWLSDRISLDRVIVETIRTMPGGVEHKESVPHRLGDYFTAIGTVPDPSGNPCWFFLTFQRRPDAGRYWKDLMVDILQEIEASAQRPAIELEAKGDAQPAVLAEQV